VREFDLYTKRVCTSVAFCTFAVHSDVAGIMKKASTGAGFFWGR
jgi:hypothetical protein